MDLSYTYQAVGVPIQNEPQGWKLNIKTWYLHMNKIQKKTALTYFLEYKLPSDISRGLDKIYSKQYFFSCRR